MNAVRAEACAPTYRGSRRCANTRYAARPRIAYSSRADQDSAGDVTFGTRATLQQHSNISLAQATGTDRVQVLTAGSQRLDGEADLVMSVLASDATVLLPKIRNAVPGKRYWMKRLGAGKITLVPSAGELIDAAPSAEVPDGASFRIVSVNVPAVRLWIIVSEPTAAVTLPHTHLEAEITDLVHVAPWLVPSTAIHASGSTTAASGEMVRYQPVGGMEIRAPASPASGDHFAIKNMDDVTTSITVHGNGSPIEALNAMDNEFATPSTGIAGNRIFALWMYDGTNWLFSADRN